MNELHPYAIVGIEVEGLFGYIDQRLTTNEDNRDKISRLAILYGENGTGKTTLLRLAFHLLSPRIDRGHKSWIATTPFKSLSITLRDGTSVRATRDAAQDGDYTFSVKCHRKKALTHHFKIIPDRVGVPPYEFSPDLQQALTERASTVFFLRDDRLIEVEVNNEGGPTPWGDDYDKLIGRVRGRKIDRREEELMLLRELREEPDLLGAALSKSIERLDRWFSVQYGQRTKSGMASSHAIYEEVIKKVASANKPQTAARSLTSLIENLVKVSKESSVFESYGLSTRMNVNPIVESLKSAGKQQTPTLHALLAPYVDTVNARFAELRNIYETIDTFVSQANHFMDPKRVTYRVGEGLRIFSPRDQQLRPAELSSGERHLLLILMNAVLAKSQRTLFIIDEPEISLNATWQRDFGTALLAVSKDSTSQFLLASHSLALISPYREHVLRLALEGRPD